MKKSLAIGVVLFASCALFVGVAVGIGTSDGNSGEVQTEFVDPAPSEAFQGGETIWRCTCAIDGQGDRSYEVCTDGNWGAVGCANRLCEADHEGWDRCTCRAQNCTNTQRPCTGICTPN